MTRQYIGVGQADAITPAASTRGASQPIVAVLRDGWPAIHPCIGYRFHPRLMTDAGATSQHLESILRPRQYSWPVARQSNVPHRAAVAKTHRRGRTDARCPVALTLIWVQTPGRAEGVGLAAAWSWCWQLFAGGGWRGRVHGTPEPGPRRVHRCAACSRCAAYRPQRTPEPVAFPA